MRPFLLHYCIAYIEYLERFSRYLVSAVSLNTESNGSLGYQRHHPWGGGKVSLH
jgi:hypothetical protein